MKLLVLGGTGGVGRHVVDQALDAGHEVTVLARTPAKVTRPEVRVVAGGAFDPDAVRAAVEGQDAVLSCLGSTAGPQKHVSLRTMAGNLADAMTATGVRRVVWCASEGVDGEIPGLFGKLVMTMLAKPLADHRAAQERLRAAGFVVTVVRPRALNDAPLRTDDVEDRDGPSPGWLLGVPGLGRPPHAQGRRGLLLRERLGGGGQPEEVTVRWLRPRSGPSRSRPGAGR